MNGRHWIAMAALTLALSGCNTGGCNGDFHVPGILTFSPVPTTTFYGSLPDGGGLSNGTSGNASASRFARYVAFESLATNLVGIDSNGVMDIYVNDTWLAFTVRVSESTGGTQADGPSFNPDISPDGRFVVFSSTATNLVVGDTNGEEDVFLRDRDSDADGIFDEGGAVTTVRVSTDATGTQVALPSTRPTVSWDGAYVAFQSLATTLVAGDTNGASDIFIKTIAGGAITLRSCDTAGNEGDAGSMYPRISGDGTWVIFFSAATNLVAGDTNGASDVFVKSRTATTIVRVSVTSAGAQTAGLLYAFPSISYDGSRVAFASDSATLVAGDSNGDYDVFVHDRDTDSDGILDEGGSISTTCMSVNASGSVGSGDSTGPRISGDGVYVAFESTAANLVSGDSNGFADVFRRRVDDPTSIVRASLSNIDTQGSGDSSAATISADGRFVVFSTNASDFVTDDTNGVEDVLVRDADGHSRVSLDSSAQQVNDDSRDPALSLDGRYVAFESDADDLVPGDTNDAVDIFVRDTFTGRVVRVSVNTGGTEGDDDCRDVSISGNGRFVVFESHATNLDVVADTNFLRDIYLRDRDTDADGIFDEAANVSTIRVSLTDTEGEADGNSYRPKVSDNGNLVLFDSGATNLLGGTDTNGVFDVFVRDVGAATTTRVSLTVSGGQPDGDSFDADFSADGRFVSFQTDAGNMDPGVDLNGLRDIYVRDRTGNTTVRVSLSTLGAEITSNYCENSSISDNGRYVCFDSFASNLVTGDTNGSRDIFVRDRDTDNDTVLDEGGFVLTSRVSVTSGGSEGNGFSINGVISANGRTVAFESRATNLGGNIVNGVRNIYVHDIGTGSTLVVSLNGAFDETNGDCFNPAVSGDGRAVVFDSSGTNLILGDTNSRDDLFLEGRL